VRDESAIAGQQSVDTRNDRATAKTQAKKRQKKEFAGEAEKFLHELGRPKMRAAQPPFRSLISPRAARRTRGAEVGRNPMLRSRECVRAKFNHNSTE
jgi:hypothetical protein